MQRERGRGDGCQIRGHHSLQGRGRGEHRGRAAAEAARGTDARIMRTVMLRPDNEAHGMRPRKAKGEMAC